MKKIIILLLTFTFVLTLSSCKKKEEFQFDVPQEYAVNKQTLSYADHLNQNNPLVTIHVQDIGDIQIQLFPDVAPNTVNNFIEYIQDGDYTNNEFHRVINSVLIQGGHLDNPACTIPLEVEDNDLLHMPGIVSMARPNGTNKDNATSEFFILMTTNADLDGSYTPFGGVVSGFYIVEYIASLEVDQTEVPITTITISSISIDLRGYTPANRVCTVE